MNLISTKYTNQWISIFDNIDNMCNECNTYVIKQVCDNCGEGVCFHDYCCEKFPHYNNTIFIICRGCVNKFEQNLYILEEADEYDLQLLKKKIKKKIDKHKIILKLKLHHVF